MKNKRLYIAYGSNLNLPQMAMSDRLNQLTTLRTWAGFRRSDWTRS
jgi:7,8-dihydro-6-hydroxymethylpterin-pyrophosphokinase